MIGLLLRLWLVLFASGAALYATELARAGTDRRPVDTVAAKLIDGLPFKAEDLDRIAAEPAEATVFGYCRGRRLRNVAIVKLAAFEAALAGLTGTAAARADDAYAATEEALLCTPGDGFLWLALARIEIFRAPLSGLTLDHLTMSHRLVPSDGWVLFRRIALEAGIWRDLPDDMKARAKADFGKLVQARSYWIATALVRAAEPSVATELLASAETVPQAPRNDFARYLAGSKVYDAKVPWLFRQQCQTTIGRFNLSCL